jgi:hypothetical protein
LVWAHTFIDDQVESQLSAQQIYFPERGSDSLNDPAVKPYIEQYAGEQVTNGEQAKAYADHYIKVHLNEMTGGQTYSQLSAQSLEQPDNEELASQVQTVFRGETLRGLLLNAYAFWKIGQIALYAAIAAFIGAGVMLLLSGLGLLHLRRAPADQEGSGLAGAASRVAADVVLRRSSPRPDHAARARILVPQGARSI